MSHIHFFVYLFCIPPPYCIFFFFFNDTATTEIYTLSLHDALPICIPRIAKTPTSAATAKKIGCRNRMAARASDRSEEHTSELQSRLHLVCRLLLEKKKKKKTRITLSISLRKPVNIAFFSTILQMRH